MRTGKIEMEMMPKKSSLSEESFSQFNCSYREIKIELEIFLIESRVWKFYFKNKLCENSLKSFFNYIILKLKKSLFFVSGKIKFSSKKKKIKENFKITTR